MIEKSFKYVIEGTPIDYFYTTFSKEKLIQSYKDETSTYGMGGSNEFEKNLEDNYDFVVATVERLSGEKPHTVRYFSIHRYGWCDMEICALAKIDNNGTTYLFTNNREYANFTGQNSGYDFDVKVLS